MKNDMRPQLRFPGFADAWVEKKLGEIGNTFTSLSGKTADDFGHGNASFITYMNVYSNPVCDHKMVGQIEIDPRQNEVKIGDVFFTISSETPEEVGMSSVLKEKCYMTYLNSFCFGFRPFLTFDLDYLAYVLRSESVRRKIRILAQGISRYNISKTKMMEIEIQYPTLPEQHLIGTFFSSLDRLISLNKQKLSSMKEYKKSMIQRMFPKAGNLPELRFLGFSDEWVEKQVKEVATIVGGNSWKHSDYKNNGDHLVVTISNVSGDNFINDKIGNRLFCDPDNAYILNENDILISLTGNVGRVSKMTAAKGVLNQRVGKVIPNENIVPNFLFYQLNNPRFESTMVYAGQGGAQKNISNSDVLSYSITTPQSKTEQSLIGSFFSNLDRLITLQSQKLSALDLYKKALLQRMFA